MIDENKQKGDLNHKYRGEDEIFKKKKVGKCIGKKRERLALQHCCSLLTAKVTTHTRTFVQRGNRTRSSLKGQPKGCTLGAICKKRINSALENR